MTKKKKEEDLRFEELQTSVLKRAFKELQITSDPKILFSYLHLCLIISTPIVMCDCWGKHQSCSHRSGDGEVRPHIWGEVKDVGTEIYRLRFNVCPPRLAVSIVYVVTTTTPLATAPWWSFTSVGVRVCVCVHVCAYTICGLFLGLGGETLHSCGGDMWNFPSRFACRISDFSTKTLRVKGFLKILSVAF